MTHVSGSTKLFGKTDSLMLSHSNIGDSTVSLKSKFSSELAFRSSGNWLRNLIPEVKKEHVSDNASSKSDSGSIYNSKSFSETKKHYRLYPTSMKNEIL
jgi:hypothetical protein